MTDAEKFIELMTKIVRKEIKELGAPFSPAKAKVARSYTEGSSTIYSDIILLKADGGVDEDFHPIKVEAPSLLLPGSIVRVGFYYFDASQPYIDTVISGGGA